jgi:hypothetical protein
MHFRSLLFLNASKSTAAAFALIQLLLHLRYQVSSFNFERFGQSQDQGERGETFSPLNFPQVRPLNPSQESKFLLS